MPKTGYGLYVLFGGMIAVALGLVCSPAAESGQRASRPVVVELFTSEGCSSCPPADRLLATLAGRRVAGAKVIALAEHVDYWDGPRWRDPFAAKKFTARQGAYAHSRGKSNVYTPQMVVDGEYAIVGNQPAIARQAIARARKSPKAHVTIKRVGRHRIAVRVSALPPAAFNARVDVELAVTEDNLQSHIRGGENGGRTLDYSSVVRSLRTIGHIRAKQAGVHSFTANVPLQPRWKRRDLDLVAVVQVHRNRNILGAASAPIATVDQ